MECEMITFTPISLLDKASNEINKLSESQPIAGRIAGLSVSLVKTVILVPNTVVLMIEALAYTIINGIGSLFSEECKDHLNDPVELLTFTFIFTIFSPICAVTHLFQSAMGVLFDPSEKRNTYKDSIPFFLNNKC